MPFSYKKYNQGDTAKTTTSDNLTDKSKGIRQSLGRGSLTIEAALVIPVFLMFVAALIHLFILMSLQVEIQLRIDETARDIGKRAYLTDDSEILSLASSNFLVVQAEILNETLTERLNNSSVCGGAGGVNAFLSSYDNNSGILDIVVTYQYKIPYLPESIGIINIKQRCYSRAWIGEDLKGDNTEKETTASGTIVYVTPSGSVYHTTKSCPFLDLTIRAVPYDTVSSIRNKSGGKYYMCSCARGKNCDVAYITDYGTLWHADTSCSSLKRTILEIDISEVGNRKKCSKCGGEH